jgi:hypothetical protein
VSGGIVHVDTKEMRRLTFTVEGAIITLTNFPSAVNEPVAHPRRRPRRRDEQLVEARINRSLSGLSICARRWMHIKSANVASPFSAAGAQGTALIETLVIRACRLTAA